MDLDCPDLMKEFEQRTAEEGHGWPSDGDFTDDVTESAAGEDMADEDDNETEEYDLECEEEEQEEEEGRHFLSSEVREGRPALPHCGTSGAYWMRAVAGTHARWAR